MTAQHADGTPHRAATSTGSPAAPSYVLTDQHGRRVDSAAFRGKVQVVSFLFPFCTTYCPATARAMTQLQHDLAHTPLAPKVQVVVFNVDPTGASRSQLRQFWHEFGGDPADPSTSLLTGSPAATHHVVTDGFHVYYQKVTEAQQEAAAARAKAEGTYHPQPEVRSTVAAKAHVDYDIVHNDVIEIVGPSGRIRQVLDGGFNLGRQELLQAVRAAATGA
jgi:cytochrome oxidase Cu insertion factor (SCO1/SenC/PrrC family)